MKKLLSLVLVVVMLYCSLVTVEANDMSPLNLQDYRGNFAINSQGLATVGYSCDNDSSTVSLTITITLEKRTLLLFWKDVEVWTIQSNEASCNGQVSYQLTDGGTYRCTIVYEATNSDGTVDTNEYQKKLEYDPA